VTTRLLVIRHGQSTWNVEGRWQGQIDTPLSEQGIGQAEALASWLTQHYPGVGAVYASPLQRAAITAQIVAAPFGLTVQYEERLKEQHLGAFQGLTVSEMLDRYPEAYAEMQQGTLDFRFPDGESRREVYERAYAVMQDIAAAHPDQTSAVVTHAGMKRMILRRLAGDEGSKTVTTLGNTSLTVLEHDADAPHGWRIALAGSIAHLEPPAQSRSDSL
jgi:broad specificity phosphatase PhoE